MTIDVKISPAYRTMQQELHKNPGYGVAAGHMAPVVKSLMQRIGAKSLSDYGAGKCALRRGLEENGVTDFTYYPYDPAFPEYGEPKPADLVCCIDVLEHIEMEFLPAVLQDLKRITRNVGFFSVHDGPATKMLPDGRNAHLIQQPDSWWLPKFWELFQINQFQRRVDGFWVIAEPRRAG